MKKNLIALSLAAAFAFSAAPASANLIANGIDFGNVTSGDGHIEFMDLAEQFINPVTDPTGGSGMGYGYINKINGNANYCTAGGGCGLYYTVNFTGGTFDATGTQITFTGTTVDIYYLNGPLLNLFDQTSPANLATIQGGTLYAELQGHGNLGGGLPANVVSVSTGSLTGATLTLTGSGLLDVITSMGMADFASVLNGNNILDSVGGLADIAYTESANNAVLNPKDVAAGLANGCTTGQAATGAWCWQGTLNTRGTIPEPATIALVGVALLGAGLSSRRRRA
jgi:hypothetical protein